MPEEDPRTLRAARPDDERRVLRILDQTRLPHAEEWRELVVLEDYAIAIAEMQVRGAPLIGTTAAFGLAAALRENADDAALAAARERLLSTRPTAVNLRWALDRVCAAVRALAAGDRADAAWTLAGAMCRAEADACRAIGEHGVRMLEEMAARRGGQVRVMTHCNAGLLATAAWGTATAPMYVAREKGIDLHVWVSETRPRNQGALTAWELQCCGVPCTVVADNACGHLLASGEVDLCLVGADRVTAGGDVCNKIGTRLKALAATDSGVPFYAALPVSTIDFDCNDGGGIPIEERSPGEVNTVYGRYSEAGSMVGVRVLPDGTACRNPAFDVTPARLVSGLITERGIVEATPGAIAGLRREDNQDE